MSEARALPAWPYPRAIAHRGAGKLAPENTLAAFRHGAGFGYRMFEFDVKLSGDGVAVLLHDATLERTTSGHGRIDALSFGQIAQLDAGSWHSPAFAGEPVPTLAAVACYLRANGLLANIEIKPVPGTEWRTGAALALDARTLWADAGVPPLLSSFSETALAAAREAAPELPRALLLDTLPADWLDRLRALDCVALDANHRALTPEVIAAAHAAGFRVCCYTVNDVERARLLWGAGLDGLITDRVDCIEPSGT
ncbi:glycerophosphodiester phosphodiesterase [Ralstonia nicotianae]|uniref:Glycerophosphodiester phosphodiesterase, cytosolic n=4 Tax=Ralstonia solanacearum species complex TaxID=3116862 RepID=A0A0S4UAE1_RALSL|nr:MULTISPECIES: glycerophosphodiester phosphodiesterase [Ralstonia]ANH33398.1 Glycerophosphoryl diester phosphodiesterase [Ralstonia solanacearum]APF87342.1 glycerophosphodiester phosphodiesterase [Ralstonia solanacearum FJAT-1458]ARS55891.1 glycerophosphodiester phosphodiesterase [Ralstonia solanacearum FJAT-91]ESS47539.1 cytoplasmic glycerophosphodiester phosphodiesterase [Ralstonia solanacearum SD54]AGH83813.1 Glycerophosphoryl diester phosphodiesterase [Ralstonia pseudosolanacearum FQY_4]